MADDYHYAELSLENVRAFSDEQTLDLRDGDGCPSRWCVVLGENGVGKTTVLQTLGVMKPVPAFERDEFGQVKGTAGQRDGGEAGIPDWVEPDLIEYDNAEVIRFARRSDDEIVSTMRALLCHEDGTEVEIGFRSLTAGGKLLAADPLPQKVALAGKGPIVIAYGGARHSGSRNMSDFEATKPTASLFNEAVELVDPEEVLETLHYAQLSASSEGRTADSARAEARLAALRGAIADVIPDDNASDIQIGGPSSSKNPSDRSVLRFRTASGSLSYQDMSLGYRTTISWIVDLAHRLSLMRPDGDDPLRESAIVLIDEVDLHLHPKWQRELSGHLLKHFPRVQFIVTTHSPIIAQEAVAQGQPVSVIRREGDGVIILNDPLGTSRTVTYDEVVASELFDLEAPVASQTERLLRRRRELLLNSGRSEDEEKELRVLEDVAVAIQEKDAPYDAAFDRLMARVVELERIQGARR